MKLKKFELSSLKTKEGASPTERYQAYIEYLKETLEKSITYSEHIAEKVEEFRDETEQHLTRLTLEVKTLNDRIDNLTKTT